MTTPTGSRSIFLSYARDDDEPFVTRLYHDLVARGFDVWWDRESMPNRDLSFLQEIRDAIIERDLLLLVVGPQAMASDYVRAEWEFALSVCKPIHPVLRAGDFDQLPPQLSLLDTPNFCDDAQYDKAFDHLLRHLSEPPRPLGELFGVPALEHEYFERAEELKQIAEHVLLDIQDPTALSTAKRITVIHGLGGVGKSVLTAGFVRQCNIRRAFWNGIIWIRVGTEPDLLHLLNVIGLALTEAEPDFPSVELGQKKIKQLLGSRTCLIVLDDVWDAANITMIRDLIADTRCRLLITTRYLSVARTLGVTSSVALDLLPLDQATTLLHRFAGHDDPALPEIADRLSGLPLALKLAGARLAEGMSGADWLETFSRVSQIKIGPDETDDPHANLQACLELSVDQLSNDHQTLYHTLGIFPEDEWVPLDVVTRLWSKILPEICDEDCHALAYDLSRLALIELRDEDKMVTLHDLLHDYTRTKLGKLSINTHRDLLQAYRDETDQPWHTILFGDYLYRHFVYHMTEAGWQDQLIAVLTSAPVWLEQHVQQHNRRDIALEHVVNDIFEYYHKVDADAARDLLTAWLKRASPSRRPSQHMPYTSKVVAVRCAFETADIQALALALQDTNQDVQDTAIRFAFYLDAVNPKQSLALMRLISQNVMRFGLPRPRVLGVAFPMVLLLLVEQYRYLNSLPIGENTLQQQFAILQDLLRQVAYVRRWGPLRPVGNLLRTWVVWLLARYARRMLRNNLKGAEEAPDEIGYSVNSLEEFARYFDELSHEQRANFEETIPYLNHAYGSVLDIRSNILDIFASEDALSTTYINFVISGRAHAEPEAVYDTYKYVYETVKSRWPDDANRYAYTAGSIAHSMYNVLELQPEVNPEWMAFLKTLVRSHMVDSPHGYGITRTPIRPYRYYSMMYYGAIWAKVHPNDPIDLAEELLARAEADDDIELLLYIIDSFAERTTFPASYRGILRSLEPYTRHPDPVVREHLAKSLAVIRNKAREQVDEFLHDSKAPQALVDDVTRMSFDEPISELVRRMHEFITAFVVYAAPDTLSRITDSARIVIQAKSIDVALKLALKQVLNEIIGENVFAS